MEARWYFADVRWAAVRMEEVDRLIENQGDDWKPSKASAASIVNDPTGSTAMRHLSAVESLLEERESLVFLINEAQQIISGVGEVLGEQTGQVLGAYYIQHLTWDEVAGKLLISRRHCISLRDMALEWVDSVGFAHAKQGLGTATD